MLTFVNSLTALITRSSPADLGQHCTVRSHSYHHRSVVCVGTSGDGVASGKEVAPALATSARSAVSSEKMRKDTLVEKSRTEENQPTLNVHGGNDSTVVGSLGDVSDIIDVAKDFGIGDLRLVQDDVTVEITMPGGRGFVDGVLREVPVPAITSSDAVDASTIAEVKGALTFDGGSVESGAVGNGGVAESEGTSAGPESTPSGSGTRDIAVETVKGTASEDRRNADDDDKAICASDFVVTSNRVGYFYSGAKNKPPLVNVGEHIEFNKPVCVIEQLGQQYVYKTEVSGTVVNVFVEDGDPVEYDQKIMIIRPD